MLHKKYYPSDEEVEYHGNQSCYRRSADDSDRRFPAFRNQSKD
jgi:hypothetical protein